MKPLLIAAAGAFALLLSLVGALSDTDRFFHSYLFSFIFWSDLPLGALPLVMVYHLTGGVWGASTRRIFEAASDTLLLIAAFSIPLLFAQGHIYPWAAPNAVTDPKIVHKAAYLNPVSFGLRTFLYFVAWLALNYYLQRGSRAEDMDPTPKTRARLRSLSGGGLVLAGFIATFASIDWQMSVEPHWYSTIYGMIFGTAQVMTAYSFGLIAFAFCARQAKVKFEKKALRDTGNMLQILVMVWAYLSFMQYLIIWSGNLPHEVTWFLHRTQGGWQWLAFLLAAFQFGAPFILLLFRSTKHDAARLGILGGLVFLTRIIDHYWMVIPGLHPERFTLPWEAVTLWVGMGCLWLAFFLKRLNARPTFATRDPGWSLAVAEVSHD